MCRKRAERRGRVQARRKEGTRQGAVAGDGHGAKLSAGLASGWALSAVTPSCRHSEATGRRPPIRPGASFGAACPGPRARRPPGPRQRWHCAAPTSGCSPVGAVAGASPRAGRRRPRPPAGQIGANKPEAPHQDTEPARSCRQWLSRRVPRTDTLDRASAGEHSVSSGAHCRFGRVPCRVAFGKMTLLSNPTIANQRQRRRI
jgi:hypothetical protein